MVDALGGPKRLNLESSLNNNNEIITTLTTETFPNNQAKYVQIPFTGIAVSKDIEQSYLIGSPLLSLNNQ
eukprot:Pgem_evm1s13402